MTAPSIIPIPRLERNRIDVPVTLDEVPLLLRFAWLEGASGWYCQAIAPDGSTVSGPRRVCCGADLTVDPTAPGHPPGRLIVSGATDLDRRADLWEASLAYYPGLAR